MLAVVVVCGREGGRGEGIEDCRWLTTLPDRPPWVGFQKRITKPELRGQPVTAPPNAMSDPIPQSDVSRPSALPTASLLQSRTSTAARLAQSQAQNSAQYLNDIEEEWNKKVDTEIETLVNGMVDIVSLASVSCLNGLSVAVLEVERVRDSRQRQISDGTRGVRNAMSGGVDGMWIRLEADRVQLSIS